MIAIDSPEWLAHLVEASNKADLKSVFDDDSAVVALKIGKKSCVFELRGGRVLTSRPEAEPDVVIPVTAKQLAGIVDGSVVLSKAYMQGDIKPVGSSRGLLHVIELFDHESVQGHLAETLA